jgi:AcrR family transcriptional regulator
MTDCAAPTAGRRRPRDRRQQIVAHARELFVDHGFPNVSMATIAAGVGITAGALYRHFSDKADLLRAVCLDGFAYQDEPIRDATPEAFIDGTIAAVAARPYLGVLWFREIRYLPPESQREMRARLRRWTHSFLPVLGRTRPELDDGQAEILAWSLHSALAGLVTRSGRVPEDERVAGVRTAMSVLIRTQLVPTGPWMPTSPRRLPQSRRERLLLAATEQFGERGYSETSMANIAAAAGMTGPSLYGYFESKADLLRGVLDRGRHAAWFVLDRALAEADSPESALRLLVEGQLRLSRTWTRWVVEPEIGDELIAHTQRAQSEYIDEWTALVCEADPAAGRLEARMRVIIATAILSDLGRTPRVSARTTFASNVQAIAMAVLHGDQPAPSS